jgi:phosphate transport system substrate-binding protein
MPNARGQSSSRVVILAAGLRTVRAATRLRRSALSTLPLPTTGAEADRHAGVDQVQKETLEDVMGIMRKTLAVAAIGATFVAVATAQTLQIHGAGGTFPYPIYSKWFDEYHRQHANVEINYQSIGSDAGIGQITNQRVFFGASDGPLTDEQLLTAPATILHFPTVLGADVPAYNIPGVNAELKFSGPLLADIFLGKVTKWDDPAITRLNPGVDLPATNITVVHRSDGSGSTYIWVDYLAKVSEEWRQNVGVATSVNWPTGVGGRGNDGVAGLVMQTPGSLGYVELIYALRNKISYGSVQNRAGEFVKADVNSVTAAAADAAANMPPDFRVSITNAAGRASTPCHRSRGCFCTRIPGTKPRLRSCSTS